MNLFEQIKPEQSIDNFSSIPLADRMRPKTLDEFVGQKHLVGKGKILREIIENDRLYSIIFWGPPGSGKTTLAKKMCIRDRFIVRAMSCPDISFVVGVNMASGSLSHIDNPDGSFKSPIIPVFLYSSQAEPVI